MTTTKAQAQQMLDAVRAGQTLFTHADSGWLVVGPTADITVGATVTVTKRGGTSSRVVIAQVGATYVKQGVSYTVASFHEARAPRQHVSEREYRATSRCEHSDTDNNGICYSCGAYVRSADAGRTIRRTGLYR